MALFAKSDNPPKLVMLLSLGIVFIYQIYFWGFWSAFCVAMTIKFTHIPAVTWDWLYWIMGFGWCIYLIKLMAYKEMQSIQSYKEARWMQKGTSFYLLITIVAFLVFSFSPSLMLPPYGWALKTFGLHQVIIYKDSGNSILSESVRSY